MYNFEKYGIKYNKNFPARKLIDAALKSSQFEEHEMDEFPLICGGIEYMCDYFSIYGDKIVAIEAESGSKSYEIHPLETIMIPKPYSLLIIGEQLIFHDYNGEKVVRVFKKDDRFYQMIVESHDWINCKQIKKDIDLFVNGELLSFMDAIKMVDGNHVISCYDNDEIEIRKSGLSNFRNEISLMDAMNSLWVVEEIPF